MPPRKQQQQSSKATLTAKASKVQDAALARLKQALNGGTEQELAAAMEAVTKTRAPSKVDKKVATQHAANLKKRKMGIRRLHHQDLKREFKALRADGQRMNVRLFYVLSVTEERETDMGNGRTIKVRNTFEAPNTVLLSEQWASFPLCKRNIRQKVKAWYETGYVVAVKLVQLRINKQEVPHVEDWLKSQVKNCTMTYTGVPMDNNDEYPDACLPNALVKVYGDRSKGDRHFIPAVADGRHAFVFDKLNELRRERGEPVVQKITDGFKPEDAVAFCKHYKVSCAGYDFMWQRIARYMPATRSKLPTLAFYINDSHFYLVPDSAVRDGLLAKSGAPVAGLTGADDENTEDTTTDDAAEEEQQQWTVHFYETPKNDNEHRAHYNGTREEWDERDWYTHDSRHRHGDVIVCDDARVVNREFYRLMLEEDQCHSHRLRVDAKNRVVKFSYRDPTRQVEAVRKKRKKSSKKTPKAPSMEAYSILIVANEGYARALRMAAAYNSALKEGEKPYEVTPFTTPHVLLEQWRVRNGYPMPPPSHFSPDMLAVLQSPASENFARNAWYHVPDRSTRCAAIDANDNYRSELTGMNGKYDLPVASIYDDARPYEGPELVTAWYQVETTDTFAFNGNGWYGVERVDFGRAWCEQQGIPFKIVSYIPTSRTVPRDFHKAFMKDSVERLLELGVPRGDAKFANLGWIGNSGHLDKPVNDHSFTQDPVALAHAVARVPHAEVVPVYDYEQTHSHREMLMEHEEDEVDAMDHGVDNPDRQAGVHFADFFETFQPKAYHIKNMQPYLEFGSQRLIWLTVYDLAHVTMCKKVLEVQEKLGGRLCAWLTDMLIFDRLGDGPLPVSTDRAMGTFKEEPLEKWEHKKPNLELKPKCRTECYGASSVVAPWQEITKEDFLAELFEGGCDIVGGPGYGKSSLLRAKRKQQGTAYLLTGSTHRAGFNLLARTAHSTLGIKVGDDNGGYSRQKVAKLIAMGVKWIAVDEKSMIPEAVMAALLDMKRTFAGQLSFVPVGDPNQADAIEPENRKNKHRYESGAWRFLCDSQRLTLDHNYRAAGDPQYVADIAKLRDTGELDINKYGKRHDVQRWLAYTNAACDAVNQQMMRQNAPEASRQLANWKLYTGMPFICVLKDSGTNGIAHVGGTTVFNNEGFFKVAAVTDEGLTMVSEQRFSLEELDTDIAAEYGYSVEEDGDCAVLTKELTVTDAELRRYFRVGYCITTHRAQCETIREPYAIVELARMPKDLLYVAFSRGTLGCNVNFPAFKLPSLKKCYIYMVTGPNGMKYIGSTEEKDPNTRWASHIKSDGDGALLHQAMAEHGHKSFRFKVIRTLHVADTQQKWLEEACCIKEHGTLTPNGYNMQLPICPENAY